MVLSFLILIVGILLINYLQASRNSAAPFNGIYFLILIWFLVHLTSLGYSSSSILGDYLPLFLGTFILGIFGIENHRRTQNFIREMKARREEHKMIDEQLITLNQDGNIIQKHILQLNARLDQASSVYDAFLSMSAILDFEETLKAYVRCLANLDGFQRLYLILSLGGKGLLLPSRIMVYKYNHNSQDLMSFPAKNEEEKFLIEKGQKSQILKSPDPAFIKAFEENSQKLKSCPFYIIPLFFQKDFLGTVVYLNHSDSYYDQLELLSLHFAMEVKKALLYEKIKHLATIDNLSGTYLKRHFSPVFAKELERHRKHQLQLSIMIIDIDHLKQVNDRFGHLIGDQVIKKVAKTIKNRCREEDLVARFGGDEFIIALPGASKEKALHIADRIGSTISSLPFQTPEHKKFRVSVSIGLALFPQDGQAPLQLIEKADQALYSAKTKGRNRIEY